MLNTVKKGDSLEHSFLSCIKNFVHENNSPFNPDLCRFFHKKKYYSNERQGNIEFDVTLEVFNKDQDKPFIIIFFECKNYNKNVSTGDIETFSSQVMQVAKHNGKAVMVTSKGFSKGVMSLAENWGVGLIRVFEDDQIKWLLQREVSVEIVNYKSIIESALEDREFQSKYFKFYCCLKDLYSLSLYEFISNIIFPNPKKKLYKN